MTRSAYVDPRYRNQLEAAGAAQLANAVHPLVGVRLRELDRIVEHVFSDPRYRAEWDWLRGHRWGTPWARPNFDWWEPTTRWRREAARARDAGL